MGFEQQAKEAQIKVILSKTPYLPESGVYQAMFKDMSKLSQQTVYMLYSFVTEKKEEK